MRLSGIRGIVYGERWSLHLFGLSAAVRRRDCRRSRGDDIQCKLQHVHPGSFIGVFVFFRLLFGAIEGARKKTDFRENRSARKGKNGVQTKEIFLPRITFLFDTDQDDRFGPYHFRLGDRVRDCRVAAGYFFNRDVRPKVVFGDKIMTGLSGFVTIVPSPILFNGNQ